MKAASSVKVGGRSTLIGENIFLCITLSDWLKYANMQKIVWISYESGMKATRKVDRARTVVPLSCCPFLSEQSDGSFISGSETLA